MKAMYDRIKYLIGEKQKVGIERIIKDSFERGEISDHQRVELKILFNDLESELAFDSLG